MRPTILHVGGTLHWTIRTRNIDTQVLKDADSTPTVVIVKNNTVTGDSVTVTKRAATTGIYDCSYNPAGEAEGEEFTVEESATVTGTTTPQATYSNSWSFVVVAVERGTDGANTTAPPTASANASQVRTELTTELARIDTTISSRSTLTATQVWEHATRSLTTFGTLVSDIWSAAVRTITGNNDKTGYSLTTPPLDATATQAAAAAAIAASGLATGAAVQEVLDAVEAIEGGGGASAEEIVDEIVARGITAIPVQSGVTSSGNLELVQGDTYNGAAKPLLSFPTSANYTDGWTATLTIRDRDDAVIATASGVVASSTQVTVSLTAPTGLTFTGCPGVWQGKFDVQMSKTTQRATIAKGVAYVYEDQTRS